MTTLRQRILFLAAVLAFFNLAIRSEQPQKASRATPEDRLKKLEERADAAEKAASSAVMEKTTSRVRRSSTSLTTKKPSTRKCGHWESWDCSWQACMSLLPDSA